MPTIDLVLTYTSKQLFSQDEYQIYHEEIKTFADMKEVKEYLKDQFYYCKTTRPIYCEKKDGTVFKSGKIYCYNERTNNTRGKDYTMNIQVWCCFYEVTTKSIDLSKAGL